MEFSVEISAKTFWHRQLITAPPSRIGLRGSINYVGLKLTLVESPSQALMFLNIEKIWLQQEIAKMIFCEITDVFYKISLKI